MSKRKMRTNTSRVDPRSRRTKPRMPSVFTKLNECANCGHDAVHLKNRGPEYGFGCQHKGCVCKRPFYPTLAERAMGLGSPESGAHDFTDNTGKGKSKAVREGEVMGRRRGRPAGSKTPLAKRLERLLKRPGGQMVIDYDDAMLIAELTQKLPQVDLFRNAEAARDLVGDAFTLLQVIVSAKVKDEDKLDLEQAARLNADDVIRRKTVASNDAWVRKELEKGKKRREREEEEEIESGGIEPFEGY